MGMGCDGDGVGDVALNINTEHSSILALTVPFADAEAWSLLMQDVHDGYGATVGVSFG